MSLKPTLVIAVPSGKSTEKTRAAWSEFMLRTAYS